MSNSDKIASGILKDIGHSPSEARNRLSKKDGIQNAPGRAVSWSKTPDDTDPSNKED